MKRSFVAVLLASTTMAVAAHAHPPKPKPEPKAELAEKGDPEVVAPDPANATPKHKTSVKTPPPVKQIPASPVSPTVISAKPAVPNGGNVASDWRPPVVPPLKNGAANTGAGNAASDWRPPPIPPKEPNKG